MLEFRQFVNAGEYMEAVNFTRNLPPLYDEAPFRDRLFGDDAIFVKALRQAKQRGAKTWLSQLSSSLAEWWCERPGDGQDAEWCRGYRKRLLKAQIRCAQRAILIASTADVTTEDWAKLAKETGFPIGWVWDVVTMLLDGDLYPSPARDRLTRIPVVLEASSGNDGIAGYLFLEAVAGPESPPYTHPVKMSGLPFDEAFEQSVFRAFTCVQAHGPFNDRGATLGDLFRRLQFWRPPPRLALPTLRWWVERATHTEKRVDALKGPSLFGAFAVGAICSIKESVVNTKIAVSFDGDSDGRLTGIGGLAAKCRAARRHRLRVIISSHQDREKGDNRVDGVDTGRLRPVLSIAEALAIIEVDIDDFIRRIRGDYNDTWDASLFETMQVAELQLIDEIIALIRNNSRERLLELARGAYDLYLLSPPHIIYFMHLGPTNHYLIATYLYQAIRDNDYDVCRHRQFIYPIHQHLSKMIRETQPDAERRRIISHLIGWLTSEDVPDISRDFAAFELGMCKAQEAIGDLLEALNDPVEILPVRNYAAMALGMIRDRETLIRLTEIYDRELNAEIKKVIAHAIMYIWRLDAPEANEAENSPEEAEPNPSNNPD